MDTDNTRGAAEPSLASAGSHGDACREEFRRWAEETLPDAQENSVGECLDPRRSWAWQGWLAGQRAATLTDAEREAVEWCVEMAVLHATECEDEIAALRGLLERLK